MSKSRLEKFLYALYSLDSSDLPNPLSRIEELYKCLVTGEEPPTFEPLSRVEKYLMAILGLYDLETQVEQGVLCAENNDVIVDENENYICLDEVMSGGIPAPISRIEKLLYKLATGDDNLDDVKSFLSKHEELLAEIIRNGGVGGNIDIEYVLYTLSTEFNTLYNTAEKPVKSAILKGQTLVNLVGEDKKRNILANGKDIRGLTEFSGSKEYTVYFKVEQINNNGLIRLQYFNGSTFISGENKNIVVGVNTITLTTPANTTDIRFQNANGVTELIIDDLMILEGNYTNVDITYFVGMQSVKMPVLKTTGKNLFNKNNIIVDGYITSNGTLVYETGDNRNAADFIEVEPNCIYSISGIKNSAINGGRTHQYVGMYDKNKKFISSATIYCLSDSATFTTTENTKYIRVSVRNDDINRLQIEKGTATTYEPHKSNILTVNEPVELRKVGNIQDELDLSTGKLTQRIGEIELDGSENWASSTTKENTQVFYYNSKTSIKYYNAAICDKFRINVTEDDVEKIVMDKVGQIYIAVEKTKSDSVSKFKTWLSNNNIFIQYQLATESIKTVDLSVVDQDGNDTKLKTFNDLTHVTLSSEGLIPEAELEVATKNEEVLNTMSLEMDDISATQTTLDEASNTQSENVDSTMIATTEIYEGLL